MGRKSKITDQMRWTANFLYYHSKCSITRIGKHLEISQTTANKLIVSKDEWEKMDEQREMLQSSKIDLDYLVRVDALEFMKLYPGAIEWLRERTSWRQLEAYEERAKKITLGEHEKLWVESLRVYLKDKTPPPKEQT